MLKTVVVGTAVAALAIIALPIPFEIGRWLISITSMVLATAFVALRGQALLRWGNRGWSWMVVKALAIVGIAALVWPLVFIASAFAILAGNNFVVHVSDPEECRLVRSEYGAKARAAGGLQYRRVQRSETTGWPRVDDALYCTRIQLSR